MSNAEMISLIQASICTSNRLESVSYHVLFVKLGGGREEATAKQVNNTHQIFSLVHTKGAHLLEIEYSIHNEGYQ